MTFIIEKKGSIRIYGNGIVEDFYYYSKKEAIRIFKEKHDLKYKRNIKFILN